MKRTVTNLELLSRVGEYNEFQRMFPHISEEIGVTTFLNRYADNIKAVNAAQWKLLQDNVEFDGRGQPAQVQVGGKIVEMNGVPKEQPTLDWKYKSEAHKEAFVAAEKELKEAKVEIVL
jgi:hypothetical protein